MNFFREREEKGKLLSFHVLSSNRRGQNQTPHTNQCLKLEKAKNPPIVVGNGLSHLFDDLFVKKFEGL